MISRFAYLTLRLGFTTASNLKKLNKRVRIGKTSEIAELLTKRFNHCKLKFGSLVSSEVTNDSSVLQSY